MSGCVPAGQESVFTYGAPALKFGAHASDEIGFDLAQHGAHRVLVVTDAGVSATGAPQRIARTWPPTASRRTCSTACTLNRPT